MLQRKKQREESFIVVSAAAAAAQFFLGVLLWEICEGKKEGEGFLGEQIVKCFEQSSSAGQER